MYRTFDLTLTSSYATIWDSLIAAGTIDNIGQITGTTEIVTDRVCQLDLTPGAANTGDVTVADHTGGTGFVLTNLSKRSSRNSICLKDYKVKGSDNAQVLVVEIESI